MSEWKEFKLEEITTKITDGKHGDCVNQAGSGWYFVSCKDIANGTIDYGNARQITESDALEVRKRIAVEPEDSVMTNSGTIGRMAYITDDPRTYRTAFQKSVAVIKPDKNAVDPKFLYYLLLNSADDLARNSNGSAQKNLLLGTMREYRLKIPEVIRTQQEIVSILSTFDELIENNRKQIKLLEEAAQRLYKEWFVDLRFPGYETVSINPETKLPKTWANGCLLDYVGFIRGRSYGSNNLVENGSKRLVNLNNVAAFGGWASGAEKGYEGPFKAEQQVYEGDVLMAVTDMTKERRLVGHAARVPKGLDGSIISMDLIKLVSDVFPSEYLYCYLRYSGVAGMIALLANGTNVLHLKPEALNRVEIPIPDIAVCRAYADQVKSQLELIDYLEMQISSAREARDRLLPKLMSSEIEVG